MTTRPAPQFKPKVQLSSRKFQTPKRGAIPNLPVLHYSAGGSDNFYAWREELTGYVSREYSLLGSIIESCELYGPEDVPEEDIQAYDPDNDPIGIKKTRLLERTKYAERKKLELADKLPSVFAVIMGQLSAESKDKIQLEPTWDEINSAKDPVRLMLLIVKTHQASSTGMEDIDKSNARDEYNSLRQQPHESAIEFKRRFQNQLKALEAVGETVPPDTQQAIDFLKWLDQKRFAELYVSLQNERAKGHDTFPKTLDAACNLASNYKVVVATKGISIGGGTPTVFATTSAPTKKTKRSPKRGGGAANPGGKDRTQSGRTGASGKKANSGRTLSLECNLCHQEGHFMKDCPELEECKRIIAAKQNNCEARHEHANISFATHGDDLDEVVLMAASDSVNLGKFDVLLDNQSTVHVYRERALLTNIRTTTVPINVTGIGGAITVTKEGDSELLGQVALYDRRVPANILSFGLIAEKFHVSYNNDERSFTVHVPPDIELVFHNRGNLYVCNLRDVQRSPRQLACSDKHLVMQTVQDNERQYTKRQII